MIGLLIGAAILGLIIAGMEQVNCPGWGKMIVCVLAASIPAAIVNMLLPHQLVIIGLAVGAFPGCAISAFCGMSLRRSSIAAGIYLRHPGCDLHDFLFYLAVTCLTGEQEWNKSPSCGSNLMQAVAMKAESRSELD